MVTAGGSWPVSYFPATVCKKLDNDPLLKSTDNRYVFGEIMGSGFYWDTVVCRLQK